MSFYSEANTLEVLRHEINRNSGAQISDIWIMQKEDRNLVRLVVHSPYGFSASDVGSIEAKLPQAPDDLPVELRLRHIKFEVMTKEGAKYDSEMSDNALVMQALESVEAK